MGMVSVCVRERKSELIYVFQRNIPVDFKYIADPTMHSMPAVAQSRNGRLNRKIRNKKFIGDMF